MKKTPGPDIADSINKIEGQLFILQGKMDTLISRLSSQARPFQQPPRASNYGEKRQENNYRERVLYKAVCADCRKECEVPFKPSGERPVYCKECFSKRKGGGSFRGMPARPAVTVPAAKAVAYKPLSVKTKKPSKKKKPSGKKRG